MVGGWNSGRADLQSPLVSLQNKLFYCQTVMC